MESANSHVFLHRLPDDVIGDIFLLGLGDAGDYGTEGRYLDILTSTCSLLRAIALATPFLWTNIAWQNKGARKLSHDLANLKLGKLSAYLERSGRAAIDLTLCVAGCNVFTCSAIWRHIAPHLPRCRSLSITVPQLKQLEVFLPLREPMHSLTNLSVHSTCDAHRLQIFADDSSAPSSLQKVIFNSDIVTECSMKTVPVNALLEAYIHITEHKLPTALEFLGKCSSLEKLTLLPMAFTNSIPLHDTPKPLVLPQLTSLTIKNDDWFSFRGFILTPKLEELFVSHSRATWTGHSARYDSNITVSDCLRTLTVQSFVSSPFDRLLSFLRLHPTITALNVRGWLVGQELVRWLAGMELGTGGVDYSYANGGFMRLPDLRSLGLKHCFQRSRRPSGISVLLIELLTRRPELCLSVEAAGFLDRKTRMTLVERFSQTLKLV